jgi:hypothetical protein
MSTKILFDPQSQGHVFCNAELVTAVRPRSGGPVDYMGVGTQRTNITEQAEFKGILVDFDRNARVNILSQSMLRMGGHEYGYDYDDDYFWLQLDEVLPHF